LDPTAGRALDQKFGYLSTQGWVECDLARHQTTPQRTIGLFAESRERKRRMHGRSVRALLRQPEVEPRCYARQALLLRVPLVRVVDVAETHQHFHQTSRSIDCSAYPRRANPCSTPWNSCTWKTFFSACIMSTARLRKSLGKVWSISEQERNSGSTSHASARCVSLR